MRFHIGLEAVEDFIADLERGFAALAAAAGRFELHALTARRRFALAQDEIEIAQIDEDAERLAGDEDRILAVERIDQKQQAAGDGEIPRTPSGMTLRPARSEAIHCTRKRMVNRPWATKPRNTHQSSLVMNTSCK